MAAPRCARNRRPTPVSKERQTFSRRNRSPEDAGARNHVARVCFHRRSYVGVELVQWLSEQCLYVRCRTTAVRVWQVLLELGVLLSGKPHGLTLTRLEVVQLNTNRPRLLSSAMAAPLQSGKY